MAVANANGVFVRLIAMARVLDILVFNITKEWCN